jgi:hypothetical protein
LTPEVEQLAQNIGMLPAVEDDLALSLQALHGLHQAMAAVAAYLTTLAEKIKQLPLVMEPDQARWLDEYRTLSRLHPLWLKSAETDFFLRASLAAIIPTAPLKTRKGLAVVQTLIFSWLKPVFAQAGLRHPGAAGGLASREPGAKAIACRATAELINSFTTYRTTPQAVSSEVGRQVERQDKGIALLARESTADKVSD